MSAHEVLALRALISTRRALSRAFVDWELRASRGARVVMLAALRGASC